MPKRVSEDEEDRLPCLPLCCADAAAPFGIGVALPCIAYGAMPGHDQRHVRRSLARGGNDFFVMPLPSGQYPCGAIGFIAGHIQPAPSLASLLSLCLYSLKLNPSCWVGEELICELISVSPFFGHQKKKTCVQARTLEWVAISFSSA